MDGVPSIPVTDCTHIHITKTKISYLTLLVLYYLYERFSFSATAVRAFGHGDTVGRMLSFPSGRENHSS